MDSKHRRAINENEQHLKSIDINKLRYHVEKSKLFTSAMLEDIFDRKEACLIKELPTRGPNAFYKFLEVLKKACEYEAAEKLEKSVDRIEISNVSALHNYAVSPNKVRNCLIINNVYFARKFTPRLWSITDAKTLIDVFETVGYKVRVRNNSKKDKMLLDLKKAAECDSDSCVVIILSYSDLKNNCEIIYGTDLEFLYGYKILELFESMESKVQNKLTVLFFPSTSEPTPNEYSAVIDEPSNVSCKYLVIVYFPSELIKGISVFNIFSEILLNNYKEKDESMLRKAIVECQMFKIKTVQLKSMKFCKNN